MEFEDAVFEIFTCLSAKSVSKFALISRGCKGFAYEDLFIKKQCHNMKLKDDSDFVLQPHSCQRYIEKVELHSLHSNEFSPGIPHESLEFLNRTSRVLASSNGLLCCRDVSDNKGSLFMCNPVTQTWCPIPSPSGLNPSKEYKLVFECDIGSTNVPHDYKLIIFMEEEIEWASRLFWKMYLPEEGIWKENGDLNFGQRAINFEMPVFHNGVVHFVTDCFPYLAKESPYYWPYIVSLNIADGTSKLLSIPKNARKGLNHVTCRLGIFKWGTASSSSKSICLVKLWKKKCCVWVLHHYNSSSWTRILNRRVQTMGFSELNPTIAGFMVLNGKSLMLATKEKVYSYDLTSENEEKVEVITRHKCGENVLFHSYSSTLRPCGNGAESISTF